MVMLPENRAPSGVENIYVGVEKSPEETKERVRLLAEIEQLLSRRAVGSLLGVKSFIEENTEAVGDGNYNG